MVDAGPWRVTVCPRCRYDLSGLPARHACPECGFAYDESMFTFGAWIDHGRPRWGQAILLLALLMALAMLGWQSFQKGRLKPFPVMMAVYLLYRLIDWAVKLRRQLHGETDVVALVHDDGIDLWGRNCRRFVWASLDLDLVRRGLGLTILLSSGRGRPWRFLLGDDRAALQVECSEPQLRALFDELQRTARRRRGAAAATAR